VETAAVKDTIRVPTVTIQEKEVRLPRGEVKTPEERKP
jgi:hypothetical protein